MVITGPISLWHSIAKEMLTLARLFGSGSMRYFDVGFPQEMPGAVFPRIDSIGQCENGGSSIEAS